MRRVHPAVSSDSRARDHRTVGRQPDAAERGHIGEDLKFSLPPMPVASLAGGLRCRPQPRVSDTTKSINARTLADMSCAE